MRCFFTISAILLSAWAFVAPAQDQITVKFQPPAYRGFVFSADCPKSWRTSIDVQEFWFST
jgi:hypothetical protein